MSAKALAAAALVLLATTAPFVLRSGLERANRAAGFFG